MIPVRIPHARAGITGCPSQRPETLLNHKLREKAIFGAHAATGESSGGTSLPSFSLVGRGLCSDSRLTDKTVARLRAICAPLAVLSFFPASLCVQSCGAFSRKWTNESHGVRRLPAISSPVFAPVATSSSLTTHETP